jgi:hypothetical protein
MDQERKKLPESCCELDEVDRASNDLDKIDERVDGDVDDHHHQQDVSSDEFDEMSSLDEARVITDA